MSIQAPTTAKIGFWELVLYATTMNFGIRWLATAAAAGPGSLPIWIIAALGFLAPLSIAAAELVGRFEGEGAIYVWTRDTFGPFAGFLCGWIYWACNLPFFSGLLFLTVDSISQLMDRPELMQNPIVYIAICSVLALAIMALNLAGLGAGKWLSDFGAITSYALLALFVAAGAIIAVQHGPATDFAHASYAPHLDANGGILWATMVFAFGGAEGVALLRNDVKGGMSKIVRALILVGFFLVVAYVIGTGAVLSIMPASDASRLSGVSEAIVQSLARLNLAWLAPAALIAFVFSNLGGYSAWFGVAARLPFAAGLDHYLPAAFATRNPRTGAPVASILLQTAVVIVLLILGQANASLKSAYDFLVSMSVLSYTIPFVFLFAAYLRAQSRAMPEGAWRTPGGTGTARVIGTVGLVVTLSAIACSFIPSPDSTHPMQDLEKLVVASAVLLFSGAIFYVVARRRSLRKAAPS